ncbi:hypothetical protein GCM10009800_50610 [Nocardiopsis rhodophaea]
MLRLKRIDGTCRNGTCPTIYATDRGTYVVQGYVVRQGELAGQLNIPEGESAVEIPAELFRKVADDIRN